MLPSRQYARLKLGFSDCEKYLRATPQISMAEITLIAHLLNQTLSPDATVVHTSTSELDRLSVAPHFPFHLLSISAGNFPNSSSSTSDSFFSNYFKSIVFSILNRR